MTDEQWTVFRSTLPLRFWSKLYADDYGCWLWTASTLPGGYGEYRIRRGKSERAHRMAFRDFIGPIPDGLILDHRCRIRPCANPWHLELVTHAENILRGTGASARNVRKVACPQGHEYRQYELRGKRFRRCRICLTNQERERKRRVRAVQKEAASV